MNRERLRSLSAALGGYVGQRGHTRARCAFRPHRLRATKKNPCYRNGCCCDVSLL